MQRLQAVVNIYWIFCINASQETLMAVLILVDVRDVAKAMVWLRLLQK